MDKQPAIIVLFGITGDLAQRKLLPALYHLFKNDELDERTVIVGITRRDVSTEDMVKQVEQSVRDADGDINAATLKKIQSAVRMVTMSQTDPAEYEQLKQLLDGIEAEQDCCMNRLFYLSVPPEMFRPIVGNLGGQGLNKTCSHDTGVNRLLIEKPFGSDLESAKALLSEINEWFDENQVFRIDHYVAKDSVQNILAFRQQYPEVEKHWNSDHVSFIEVMVSESIGIEGRAAFYEGVGALRDFIQSHLLQILAITAMDLAKDPSSASVHASRLQLLSAIQPIREDEIATRTSRGQYEGYKEEVHNPASITETSALLSLDINSERWKGTKATLFTGKAMDKKLAEVRLTLKGDGAQEQTLVFYIQPEKGILLRGEGEYSEWLQPLIDDFNRSHGPSAHNPLGYESIFAAAISGDHSLFTTRDEVITAWEIIDEVVKAWCYSGDGLQTYPPGSTPFKSIRYFSNL